MIIKLTKNDAQEVLHKLGVLCDTPDLQDDYRLTQAEVDRLYATVPSNGGLWTVPEWGVEAVRGELADHAVVLRDIAHDAFKGGAVGESLRINKQAKKFEEMVAAE